MKLKYIEKHEREFEFVENDCDQFHNDEFGEPVCEVGENNGGNCYPWECPLCDFICNSAHGIDRMGKPGVIELVYVIREVVYE